MSHGFYLHMQGWLVTVHVARQVEICVLDAQSHGLGFGTRCMVHVGRHVQVN